LRLEDLPKGVEARVSNILTNKAEATVALTVSPKAETGKEHQFRVVASATHQDRIWRQKTQPIHLTLTAPEPEASGNAAPKTAPEKAKP
jgi:hypothetical protein